PVGRCRLPDDRHAGDGPQASADEGRRAGDPRARLEPSVESAPREVKLCARAEVGVLQERQHLRLVAAAPRGRIQPQDRTASRPATAVHPTQPFGTRGGIRPGWPSTTGSGPRTTLDVSTVSTPAPSTSIGKRSMPCGAGPYSTPSALVPSRSYRDWWQGQRNQKSSTHGFGRQPGQTGRRPATQGLDSRSCGRAAELRNLGRTADAHGGPSSRGRCGPCQGGEATADDHSGEGPGEPHWDEQQGSLVLGVEGRQ